MPYKNRVDPYGRLHAVAERGAWLGNRGVIHDENRRVVVPWRLQRWITCTLRFKNRRREVFTPRRYSELFFLDEATSFSAGHRPCAECRRERYVAFREAWSAGRPDPRPAAEAIDAVLHAERVGRGNEKATYRAPVSSLPEGAMVEHAGKPHLLWRGKLRPWSFAGYGRATAVAPGASVEVLTPASIVGALRAGYVAEVHPSAGGRP